MYLKNDMKAKMVFLNELEAAVGFTSTMMTQEYVGSTTIVPQVSFFDYFKVGVVCLSTFIQLQRFLTVLHLNSYSLIQDRQTSIITFTVGPLHHMSMQQ